MRIFNLLGCDHHWNIIDTLDFHNNEAQISLRIYILRCEHCGKIKQKSIR